MRAATKTALLDAQKEELQAAADSGQTTLVTGVRCPI